MTALERPNTPPAAIHPSRSRAPARNVEVRSNSDTSPHDTPSKMQNKPAFPSAAVVHAAAIIPLRPACFLTSHLAPIEIP